MESVRLRPLKLQPLDEPGRDSETRGVEGVGSDGSGFMRSVLPPRLSGAGD
jgi:hypothetical protein